MMKGTEMQSHDRLYYAELGLEPIPLWHGLKTPVRSYNKIPWREQWKGLLGKAEDYNIGLRLSNAPLTILDGDSPGSRAAIEATLCNLGLPHEPTVNTGGEHRAWQWWLICPDKPTSFSFRKLRPDIGDGELRMKGCYVVVPPSIVEARYTFAVADPATHLQRQIPWEDLLTFVAPAQPTKVTRVDLDWTQSAIPILTFRTLHQPIIAHTRQIELADRGDPVGKYRTRSEAMAYVVRMLLRLGWDWSDIRGHFEELAPNYLTEKRWEIHHTAAKFSAEMTPPDLVEAYETAAGRSRPQDRACYRALISEAARWSGRYEIKGGVATAETTDRGLARLMRCSPMTAHRARRRLEAAGLVHVLNVGEHGRPERGKCGKRSRYEVALCR